MTRVTRTQRGVTLLRAAGLGLCGLLALTPSEPAMSLEEPAYEIVDARDGYELRRYAGYLVAETEVAGDLEEAGNRAFRILAAFIFGDNEVSERIAMTAPVVQSRSEKIAMTAPVLQAPAAAEGRHTVGFTMPAKYTSETLPKPTDSRVRIREVPGRTLAVRTYSGRWTGKLFDENEQVLRRALERDGRQTLGAAQWARYNSPFSLPPFRRNEVWIEVDPADDGQPDPGRARP